VTRELAARAAAVAASLIFLASGARELARRGAPVRARTIASHTGFAARDSEDALLLLQRGATIIPDGATVAVYDRRPHGNDGLLRAVAVSHLARQRVVGTGAGYVIAFRDHFDDPRYEAVWAGGEGTILRRRR
jgi:hypothetical protein